VRIIICPWPLIYSVTERSHICCVFKASPFKLGSFGLYLTIGVYTPTNFCIYFTMGLDLPPPPNFPQVPLVGPGHRPNALLLGHPSPLPKRHLDQFSRVCRAHGCVRQTDTHTRRQTKQHRRIQAASMLCLMIRPKSFIWHT